MGIIRRVQSYCQGAIDVAKAQIDERTKTTSKIKDSLFAERILSEGRETSKVMKLAGSITGVVIGSAIKPFVFNPEKARNEIHDRCKNANLDDVDENALKKMQQDLRTILTNLRNPLMKGETKKEISKKLDDLVDAKTELASIARESEKKKREIISNQ